jgi:hypothetical protein
MVFSQAPKERQRAAHGMSHGNTSQRLEQPRGGRDPGSSAPDGAIGHVLAFPRLTPWANFWRPSGAFGDA